VTLKKNHRLQAWNLKSFSAAFVFANKIVINPDQVIARLLKLRPIFVARVVGKRFLLRPPYPTNLVFRRHPAFRASECCCLHFLAFGVKVSFVHADKYSRKREQIANQLTAGQPVRSISPATGTALQASVSRDHQVENVEGV
jgi:hypothetical protein